MPHVDEGTLHALLDGALRADAPERAAEVRAHLAACEDCRARLEAAAELRGEAAQILESAAPAQDQLAAIPDFRDVVRRAQARTAPDRQPRRLRRQARWTRGVAWAASLVLALGTGYLLRDLAGPPLPPRADPVERTTAADRQTAAPRSEEPAGAASPEREPGTSTEAANGAANGPANGAADGAADRAETEPTTATGAPAPPPTPSPAAAPARDPSDALSSERLEQRPPAESEAEGEAERPESDRPSPGRVADVDSAAARNAGAGFRAVAERSRDVAATGDREKAAIAAGALAEDSGRWSAITLEEARVALEGPLFLLPGAELVEIYVLADAPRARVMTLQRLQTGVPVRVVQWRGGAGAPGAEESSGVGAPEPADRPTPAMDASLPEARVARVVRGSYVLELTASLPVALLSVLGETASPAR